MSYCLFIRPELLQKAKNKYHNSGDTEKAAQYYLENKDAIKWKANNKYINLSEEKKEAMRKYRRKGYKNMKENASQKNIKKRNINFLYNIKMYEKTLTDNI